MGGKSKRKATVGKKVSNSKEFKTHADMTSSSETFVYQTDAHCEEQLDNSDFEECNTDDHHYNIFRRISSPNSSSPANENSANYMHILDSFIDQFSIDVDSSVSTAQARRMSSPTDSGYSNVSSLGVPSSLSQSLLSSNRRSVLFENCDSYIENKARLDLACFLGESVSLPNTLQKNAENLIFPSDIPPKTVNACQKTLRLDEGEDDRSFRFRHSSDDPCGRRLSSLRYTLRQDELSESDSFSWFSSGSNYQRHSTRSGIAEQFGFGPKLLSEPNVGRGDLSYSSNASSCQCLPGVFHPYNSASLCYKHRGNGLGNSNGADSAYGTASRSSLVVTPQSMLRPCGDAPGFYNQMNTTHSDDNFSNYPMMSSGNGCASFSQPYSCNTNNSCEALYTDMSSKHSSSNVDRSQNACNTSNPTTSLDATQTDFCPSNVRNVPNYLGAEVEQTLNSSINSSVPPDRRCASSCSPLHNVAFLPTNKSVPRANCVNSSTEYRINRERTRSDPKNFSTASSQSQSYYGVASRSIFTKLPSLFKSDENPKPTLSSRNRACSFYLRGHCKKEDCQFAHNLDNVVCRFWSESECFKGENCPFRHRPLDDDCLSVNVDDTILEVSGDASVISTASTSSIAASTMLIGLPYS